MMRDASGGPRPITRGLAACALLVGLAVAAVMIAPTPVRAAPEVDLHDLTWYVHVDLIDAGAGRDLAFWQTTLTSLMDSANRLLEGGQGPFDNACCTRLTSSVAVTTFGSPGDGLDVIDSLADQNAIAAIGTGSRAFLVDSTTYCAGPSEGAIGCALRPSCNTNGNDDPNLWLYVTVEAYDDGTLAAVIAHERGHNSCLQHVSQSECQLMAATVLTPGLAGCLTASECSNFGFGRTTSSSGLTCDCHDDVAGIVADGDLCSEVAGGVCSGGLCGVSSGDAGVELLAAASLGDISGPPEDAIRIAALAGNWSDLGQISATAQDVRGLAYASDSGTLYGVVPTVADDLIVTIDPTTGDLIATIGAIANGSEEFVSLAYDPGDTSSASDDRLIGLEVAGSSGEFRAIDPDSASTTTLLGSLPFGSAELFTGMAYDSIRDKLFLATPFGDSTPGSELKGLFETDLSSCPPSPCTTTQVAGLGLFRDDASLAFSAESGQLYLVGTLFYQNLGVTRTFYDIVDPTTLESREALSLDRFTPAALAAVPEPGIVTAVTAGLVGLALTARRKIRW